jgi:ATP adenylyltransferase
MNRYSYNNGHLLIVKHTHESDIEKLPEAELGTIMKITQAVVKMLKHVLNHDGFNVGDNIGKSLGAGIPQHLHVQMVPSGSAIRAISRFSITPA